MYSTVLLHYRSTYHRPGQIRCLQNYTLLHITTPGVIPTTLFYTINKYYTLIDRCVVLLDTNYRILYYRN